MIEEVHRLKGYREETLYIAISLADKVLKHYAESGKEAPSLIHLGIVCVLISAKLNQPKQPCLMNLVLLVNQWYRDLVSAPELLKLELEVITALQFDLQMET